MRMIKISLLLAFTLMAFGPVFGQTFQITDRTPAPGSSILNLDSTSTVTYNVAASGLNGTVVPVLVPHNSAYLGRVVATWTGTSATSNLSNLTFKVHLYNDGTLCAQSVQFDLLFYSTSFNGPILATANNSDLLNINVRNAATTLTKLISSTANNLPVVLTTASPHAYYLNFSVLTSQEIMDPNNHIYFWADYNLAGIPWEEQFDLFTYGLGQGTGGVSCAIDALHDINGSHIVSGNVVDATSGTPVTVPQAPLGGGGTTTTQGTGVNLFDVTDINPIISPCASTIRESVNYGTGAVSLNLTYGGWGAIVRRFALYLGQPGCSLGQTNFGTPPSTTFRIDNFYLSSAGEVSADLVVPTSWASGGQLNSNMRVQWFLRKNGKILALGGESRDQALDFVSSETITDPQNYYLEARIRRIDSNATVSTTNIGAHNRAYSLNSLSFDHGEPGGADEFLDPGETLSFNWKIDHVSGGSLPSLSYASGIVLDANGNGLLEPATDTYLANNTPTPNGLNIRTQNVTSSGSGSTRSAVANFTLLTLNQPTALWFYVDVTGSNGSTITTYRRYFSLRQLLGGSRDLDAEDTDLAYDYDFRMGSQTNQGWSVSNDASNAGSRGWSYTNSGPWIGQGGTTSQSSQDLYRLITPPLPLGKNTTIGFEHQAQFAANVSGGLVEYRTRTVGGPWPNVWSNLVSTFCSTCGYYDGTFSSGVESYLSGRQVWMNNHSSPQQVNLSVPDSVGNAYPNQSGEIQMRFLFANTIPPASLAHWELNNFYYETNQLTADNLFGFNRAAFPLSGCSDPSLSLLSWAPYALSQLTFVWYQDLNALWANNGTTPVSGPNGATVPFLQSTPGLYTYYVKVATAGIERIFPVSVNVTNGISHSQAVLQIRLAASAQWPYNQDILDYVIIANSVCSE